jgi:hypothetical protein
VIWTGAFFGLGVRAVRAICLRRRRGEGEGGGPRDRRVGERADGRDGPDWDWTGRMNGGDAVGVGVVSRALAALLMGK